MLLLPATVTVREARDTQRMLSQAMQQDIKSHNEAHVTVDASGLTQFDSSALAVLLECQRLAMGWGKGLVVRNAPAKLAELARLYGVDSLLLSAAGSPGSAST